MKTLFKNLHLSNLNIVKKVAIFAVLLLSLPAYSSENENSDVHVENWFAQTRHVEVTEDPTRFSFDEAPVFDDGSPKAGNAFITHGYIYKKGFFDKYDEGVDKDGKPVRPDLVIGEWTCRGYFVGNGMYTKKGPWVISTQTFDFYSKPGYKENQDREFGKRMVTTEGYELVDVGKSVSRAITGGTGRYSRTKGEHKQISLGLGKFEGIRAKHTLKMKRF